MAPRWTIYSHIHVASGRRYVGLTKKTMMFRWNQHVQNATRKRGKGCAHFWAAIRKYGKDAFSHEILEVCDTLEAANAAEERWIEELGTRDLARGFNLIRGGAHAPHPLRRNPWDRPEYREKQKKRLEQQWRDPAFRNAVITSGKATTATSEYKAEASFRTKSLWKNPSFRAKVTSSILPSPEARQRNVASMKSTFATSESKAKRSASSEKVWEAKRGELVLRQRELREDPDYSARVHSGLVSGASKNREKTHCLRGHEFTPENTHVDKRGSRNCIACRKAKKPVAFLSPGPEA